MSVALSIALTAVESIEANFDPTVAVMYDGVTHLRAVAHIEETAASINGDASTHVAAYRCMQADALAVFAMEAELIAERIAYEGELSAHEYARQVWLFDVVADAFGLDEVA